MGNWVLWLIVGAISVLAGLVALANPFAATITAELLTGYSFIAIGVLMLVSVFQAEGWGARIWMLVIALLFGVAGLNLVAQPLSGIVTLTLMTAVFLVFIGVARLIFAFSPLAAGVRSIVAISGAISLLLGVMIFAGFPESTLYILGVFLGVELISNGVTLIAVSLDQRKANSA